MMQFFDNIKQPGQYLDRRLDFVPNNNQNCLCHPNPLLSSQI
jgi:hypothetical protein